MPTTGPLIKVLSTTAMKSVLEAIAPGVERRTAARLDLHFAPSGRMAKRVAEGEAVDVAIVAAADIDKLIEQGGIARGSRVDIARSAIGLAVPAGAPLPDVSTVAGFKRTLLSARAIAMSNPTGGAQSGVHLAQVFERLGLTDALAAKLIFGPGGPAGLVGNYLSRGEADVGMQQMSELMAVPGIAIVGAIPDKVQLVTLFAAGISTATHDAARARALIDGLATDEAIVAIRSSGMLPPA